MKNDWSQQQRRAWKPRRTRYSCAGKGAPPPKRASVFRVTPPPSVARPGLGVLTHNIDLISAKFPIPASSSAGCDALARRAAPAPHPCTTALPLLLCQLASGWGASVRLEPGPRLRPRPPDAAAGDVPEAAAEGGAPPPRQPPRRAGRPGGAAAF